MGEAQVSDLLGRGFAPPHESSLIPPCEQRSNAAWAWALRLHVAAAQRMIRKLILQRAAALPSQPFDLHHELPRQRCQVA